MSKLTMFRGKKDGAVNPGVSNGIPSDITSIVSRQCPAWNAAALASCTMTQKKSSYKDCKIEVEILDSTGKVVVRGREFHSGEWLFWLP